MFKVDARLNVVIPRKYDANLMRLRKLRQVVYQGPRIPVRRGVATFWLSGFWSEADGKLCMVGSGSTRTNSGKLENLNVVLKLNYSSKSNLSVSDSLVSGVLESVDLEGSEGYFKPVSVLGVAHFEERPYEFTLIDKINEHEFEDGIDRESSFSMNNVNEGICSVFTLANFKFELEYSSDCYRDNISCSPVTKDVGYLPSVMYLRKVRCVNEQKMLMLLGFSNSSTTPARFPLDPKTTLFAEGTWNDKKNQLHGIACRILNFTEPVTNAYIGDCSVRLSLRFPAIFSITNRSSILGQIWSNRSENDPAYFGKLELGSSQEVLMGLSGFKYQYTMVDVANRSCANKNNVKRKGKTYPNVNSVDMRFGIYVKNSEGQTSTGFSSPLFVSDQPYQHQLSGNLHSRPLLMHSVSVVQPSNHSNMLNISYKISITPPSGFKFGGGPISETIEISAEGVYDSDMGILCMVGCRNLRSSYQEMKLAKNDLIDCEIAVNFQFRALNAEGSENVKGTIESKREKSDPLYFGRLELSSSSIYTSQAEESIWRMDLEIAMVLISNTLACVFVGLQLFYVKKHPDVLPFISVVMLVILTLRYMVPLLLNFEALFKANRNQQNLFIGSGGWLEANEIIVRVVTMVAFLLQFRLLQLTWYARQGDGSQKEVWISEKKVLCATLPLYLAGGLIAWVVYQSRNSSHGPYLVHRHIRPHHPRRPSFYQQRSLWGDLKSYAGLILDGFLLPQILLNLFFNSSEKVLAAPFYIGTTIVRLLPHAYDLYRTHRSSWYLDWSYIYANHKMDFYSTAWDIIIPCGGLLFAALIYVQQQFGGRCFLPRRFRESCVYEKIPVVSNVELQEPVHKNIFTS